MTALSSLRVPFFRPFLAERQHELVRQALDGGHWSGDGPFTAQARSLLARHTGGAPALLTTSCTHALEMTALLLDLAPGDEVIVPSFTFVSTATAYALRGATPVFVDCRPDTLNIDERAVEDAITERTKAIVVVHYAGVAADLEAIGKLTAHHDLALIEDNAHGLGGSYAGRPLGSFGAMATLSFHATKNITCGEGGALVLGDAGLAERAEIIREKGTNRGQFFRGQVDKYRWVDIGSSYLPSDILAAVLTAQLSAFDEIQARRQRVWGSYHAELATWAAAQGVTRPSVPPGCLHPAHLYYLLLPDLASRQGLQEHLGAHGVGAAFHYQPLHTSPGGRRFGRVGPGGCPVTEQIADRLLRLPLYPGLTDRDVEHVLTAVTNYRP